MTVKVIRIIQYEGTEEAVRKAIQLSKSLGEHQYNGYVMTVAEHLNELPQLIELLPEQVENDLRRGSKFNPEVLGLSDEDGPFIRALAEKTKVEEYAIKIYNSWSYREGWVPWVIGGNSTMQTHARDVARRDLNTQV